MRMGIEHGAYCVGCCWLLMALLFVGGVMNLWWVIGIALYVLLEKVVPAGAWLGRALGAILCVAGVVLLGATFTS
jgi:predicted metal-binding membrane protein